VACLGLTVIANAKPWPLVYVLCNKQYCTFSSVFIWLMPLISPSTQTQSLNPCLCAMYD
jgi:hypothetical protein